MSAWNPTAADLFFSKKDSEDPRLGDCVQAHSGNFSGLSPDLILWGYPDDEGIKLNGGRVGAALAPTEIRRAFYKMTPHFELSELPRLLDAGDVSTSLPLIERHNQGARLAQSVTDADLPWVSLGGGHDYGYADGSGFLRSHLSRGMRPLVVNLDAHLDVRPSEKSLNSGTPFYRLLTEFPGEFDFVEMGLQPQCNSRKHLNWAHSKGALLVTLEQIEEKGFLPILKQTLAPFISQSAGQSVRQPLWLSLDMDAITSNEAPGCSQSWTTGLQTRDLMKAFTWLSQSFSWKAFSIYETSPPLDFDNRTSKLAALFLHRFLSCRMSLK